MVLLPSRRCLKRSKGRWNRIVLLLLRRRWAGVGVLIVSLSWYGRFGIGDGEVSTRDLAYNARGDKVGESGASPSDDEEENWLRSVFVGDFRPCVPLDDRCFSAVRSDRFPRLSRLAVVAAILFSSSAQWLRSESSGPRCLNSWSSGLTSLVAEAFLILSVATWRSGRRRIDVLRSLLSLVEPKSL